MEPETHYLDGPDARISLAQLANVVPGEGCRRDYPYESSMTQSGQLHWDEFAQTVCKSYHIEVTWSWT